MAYVASVASPALRPSLLHSRHSARGPGLLCNAIHYEHGHRMHSAGARPPCRRRRLYLFLAAPWPPIPTVTARRARFGASPAPSPARSPLPASLPLPRRTPLLYHLHPTQPLNSPCTSRSRFPIVGTASIACLLAARFPSLASPCSHPPVPSEMLATILPPPIDARVFNAASGVANLSSTSRIHSPSIVLRSPPSRRERTSLPPPPHRTLCSKPPPISLIRDSFLRPHIVLETAFTHPIRLGLHAGLRGPPSRLLTASSFFIAVWFYDFKCDTSCSSCTSIFVPRYR
ncbi:hypothetical protein B0H13DRAFT_2373860 [Mycena leptocephala]|nr:hypothetical protein B0H13DRAFT_2373860 [Mycena leptocephala]